MTTDAQDEPNQPKNQIIDIGTELSALHYERENMRKYLADWAPGTTGLQQTIPITEEEIQHILSCVKHLHNQSITGEDPQFTKEECERALSLGEEGIQGIINKLEKFRDSW